MLESFADQFGDEQKYYEIHKLITENDKDYNDSDLKTVKTKIRTNYDWLWRNSHYFEANNNWVLLFNCYKNYFLKFFK